MSTRQSKVLLDFGRLSLQGIKENLYLYTDAEIKSSYQTLDIIKYVFFLKLWSYPFSHIILFLLFF